MSEAGRHAGDAALVRGARLRLAALVGLAVLLGVLLAAGVTWLTVTRTQAAVERTALEDAIEDARGGEPLPEGVWAVVREPDGGTRVLAGTVPGGLPATDLLDRVAETGVAVFTQVATPQGEEQLTLTTVSGGVVAQAGDDPSSAQAELARLGAGLATASVAGVALALLAGYLLAGRATRPLVEALERQRRFVADASHELRTPLARLGLRAELLRRGLPPTADDAVRRDADELVHETAEMADALTDLLLAASLRAGAPGERVDLVAVARDVVAADEPRARDRGVTLVLVPSEGPGVVLGSRGALRRAAAALVDNALEHTPRGGRVEVRVGAGPAGRVRLEVVDDGEGFDSSDLDHLRRAFARGGAGDRGFGLGLTLVDEVADAHGGRLEARSRPGAGAAVAVVLPAAEG